MHWIDWLIVVVPVAFVLGMAVYAKKYVRGVVDFLAAGRVAGRYVISVGDMGAALSVLLLVAMCESQYQCGIAISFWSKITIPIAMFIALVGYCVYRYRQTKCLSIGQFLEIRYNRTFRITASVIRSITDTIINSIGPAVAARFFIYFIGFPFSVNILGWQVSTFAIVMFIGLSMAMLVIWSGGRVSLLVTDALQGLMSYPIFVIFTIFVLLQVSWTQDVAPVMLDRIPGESFLNPMDISSLRDFNLFALIVAIIGLILNRAAWIGNDTSSAGRTPHEQKMAGIMGAWRNGFALLMMGLLALFIITVMLAGRYASEAKDVRMALVSKVSAELIQDQNVRQKIIESTATIPEEKHIIGIDEPYAQKNNPDTTYLDNVQQHLENNPAGHATFQKFRTLYYQMMAPTLLNMQLPVGIMGLFVLLMVMLMLSTDDSRIFNASSTFFQDVVMPLRRTPFEPKQHLFWLRITSLVTCLLFFTISLFFAQVDFILMFISIVGALWLGAAGPIIVGGLYTRFGTTTGAFCALVFGSGISVTGVILQRNWSSYVYPWLITSGYDKYVNSLFNSVTSIFSPYIIWEMNPVKFPINSYEVYFLSMLFGVTAYAIGSLATYRQPFNLDKMLHRRKYSDGESIENKSSWTWRNVCGKLIGIDDEYTTGDKVIAWSVFGYGIVFQFFIAFVGVLVWNAIDPWPAEWWSWYFFINIIVVGIIVGSISTVWLMAGGFIDLRRLFRDLAKRIDNPLDDGWVEDHISLADKTEFEKFEHKTSENKEQE